MTRYALAFLALAAAAGAWGSPFGAPKVADAFHEPTNPKAVSASADAARSHRLGDTAASPRECSSVTVEVLARNLDGVPQKVTDATLGATVHYQAFVKDGTGAVIDSFGWSGTPVVGGDGHVLTAEDELHRYAEYDGNNPRWQATMPLDTYRSLRDEWEARNDGQGYAMLNSGDGGLTEPLKTGRITDNEQLKMSMEVYEKNCQRALFEFAEMANARSNVGQTIPFSYPAGVVLADAVRGAVRDSNLATGTPLERQGPKSGGASIDTSKFDALADRQISYMKALIAAGKPMAANQISTYNSYLKATADEIPAMAQKIMDLHVSEDEQMRIFFNACESKLDTIVSLFNTMIANGIAGDSSRTADDEICSKLGDVVLESGRAGDDIVTTSIKACKFMEEVSKRQGKQQ